MSSDEEADENTNNDDGDSAATMVPVQRLKAGAQLEWSEAHDTELRSLWTGQFACTFSRAVWRHDLVFFVV